MTEPSNTPADEPCRFCEAKPGRHLLVEGKYGFAAYDRHPASEGHFLVIPYRHFGSYFDINDEERDELWRLVAEGKKIVDQDFNPDGYNIGINVGTWALIITTGMAIVAMLMVLGRLPMFPLIASTVTIIFGFLTIVTGDPM